MLAKPDRAILNALMALEADSNFQTVLTWMKSSQLTLLIDSAQTKDEVLCRWQQGAAQATGDFIDKVQSARSVLQKSR